MSEELFNTAVDYFTNSMPTLINSKDTPRYLRALKLYSFYKQATVGDNTTPHPVSFIDYMKWNAWNNIKGMSQETARQNYIDIYNTVNQSESVTTFEIPQEVQEVQEVPQEITQKVTPISRIKRGI